MYEFIDCNEIIYEYIPSNTVEKWVIYRILQLYDQNMRYFLYNKEKK